MQTTHLDVGLGGSEVRLSRWHCQSRRRGAGNSGAFISAIDLQNGPRTFERAPCTTSPPATKHQVCHRTGPNSNGPRLGPNKSEAGCAGHCAVTGVTQLPTCWGLNMAAAQSRSRAFSDRGLTRYLLAKCPWCKFEAEALPDLSAGCAALGTAIHYGGFGASHLSLIHI